MLGVEQLSNIQLVQTTLTTEPPCPSSLETKTTLATGSALKTANIQSSAAPPPNKSSLNTADGEPIYHYFGIDFKAPFKWFNLISISLFHLYFIWTLRLLYTVNTLVPNLLWGIALGGAGGFGVTGGVHRLWTHRAYKAQVPLRIILMICYSIAGQNTIFDWVRDHRVHHKFSETDADPHNSNRGFFFAHVGWLMMRKHPKVIEKGNQVDMSDVLNDPVVQFHQKYFVLMKIIFCFIIPTAVPIIFWEESFYNAFVAQCIIRYVLSLNFTWLVNSAAHIWGSRPFDKRINPAENVVVSFLAMGEGWHNYHHVFPWDYKAAELGAYGLNFTTFWIDLFAKIGWAYDLKEPSKELVVKTIQRHGDGTHPRLMHCHHEEVPPPEEDENANIKDKTQ